MLARVLLRDAAQRMGTACPSHGLQPLHSNCASIPENITGTNLGCQTPTTGNG